MDHGAGHYSQVVWAETNLVGCGYVHYKEAEWYMTLTVCNFAPGGNVNGARGGMYKPGEACSVCGEGVGCEDGLCMD